MVREKLERENLSPNEIVTLHALTKSPKNRVKKTPKVEEGLPPILMQCKQSGLLFDVAREDLFWKVVEELKKI